MIIPSRKFLILLSLGLVPAAMTPFGTGFWAIALIYVVGCAALLAAEVVLGVRAGQIVVRRQVSDRLNLDEEEQVRLEVRNYSRQTLRLEVQDTYPFAWEMRDLPGELVLGPGQQAELTYYLTPTRRGRFEFGDLFVRARQFPGFAIRQFRYRAEESVRVYPDMREIARYETMVRRSRLTELGIHRSRLIGRGTEFERLREYTPDDEYRQIDWKATARRHKPISRVYEVERSQNVFLVMDAGRMMAQRVGRLSKLDYAVNAAVMLAHVALRSGDRLGVMTVSDTVDGYLPLGKGQAQFNRCTELLYAVEPRLVHVDYRAALEQIALRCKRRSLVVLFTDLMDEDTSRELVSYLRILRPRHLPLCVTLQDTNIVRAANTLVQTTDEMYERTVALDMLAERRKVLESLSKQGAIILDTPPEDLTVAVVNRYLELKYRQLL